MNELHYFLFVPEKKYLIERNASLMKNEYQIIQIALSNNWLYKSEQIFSFYLASGH